MDEKNTNSYFFTDLHANDPRLVRFLEFSTSLESSKKQSYLLASPLVEKKYEYQYKNAALLIVPQEKLIFINFSSDSNHEFSNYVEEYIEDIGYMSKKYEYLNFIGRPKKWAPDITHQVNIDELGNPESILSLFSKHALDKSKKRISELVSSLVIGSINDISKIGEDLPTSPLDMVKQKIILFDTDQTKFIYDSMDDQNVIRIQGLSGTGKTELLLHKLKELYTNERDSKILLTCHNKILSDKLRSRIPSFFNFMKVESQIDWENRLKCVHAWGSSAIPDSGAYRFICHHYQIPFETFSYRTTFDQVCKNAITNISSSFIQTQPFDYILIDESQDFPDSFFELCAQVTRKKLFIAGDIFQSIFDNPEKQISKADFLLNKCYRTDPKTLMFGHAFGMKLFEERKLRWLADSEWKACGYNIEKKPLDNSLEIVYTLSREPLRRFEDLPNDENLTGIFLEYCAFEPDSLNKKIIDLISNIKNENPTIKPDDIAIIIMPDKNMGDLLYSFASLIEQTIPINIGWQVNTAYSTKQTKENHLFLTNTNNVKGLEFPFVICISRKITDSYTYRNSMYMATTRSFLKTFLVIDEQENSQENLKPIIDGLHQINNTGKIITKEPSTSEKDQIRMQLEKTSKDKNLQDFIISVYDELSIPNGVRRIINDLLKSLIQNGIKDRITIRSFIEQNHSSFQG